MLTQEQSVEIKVLARQGHGIKFIARELGISRNTVRKYLRKARSLPSDKVRPARPCKIDPFKDYLHERIEAARPHWIPATVLLREITALGYSGGVSRLKAYIRPFKRKAEEPVVRFETLPGKQIQVDFTTIRRGRQPLKAFVATLGFSRASFVRFSERENRAACGCKLWDFEIGYHSRNRVDPSSAQAYTWRQRPKNVNGQAGQKPRQSRPVSNAPGIPPSFPIPNFSSMSILWVMSIFVVAARQRI
ncbi:transposase (plasmid) [Pseudomonas syringae pv. avii]|uniref:Transposase n=1 Tax=Pseudomonas syringae pv. avii TaxID=663959 RepID=A0ABY1UEX6_PSESX|nr:transposase [Pseudomonas syringae pv. avii]